MALQVLGFLKIICFYKVNNVLALYLMFYSEESDQERWPQGGVGLLFVVALTILTVKLGLFNF